MAQALWLRTIRKHRIDITATEPCTRADPEEALYTLCRRLDLPNPIWLDKNRREWEEFGQTRFFPDDFLEHVNFERLEIEYIDPDAPKRRSQDPRNA